MNRLLYHMMTEMRGMTHQAYMAPDGRGAAVISPGMPLWIYIPEEMSDEDIRSFFYACMNEITVPYERLITSEKAAPVCGAAFTSMRHGNIAEKEIVAYCLPKPPDAQTEGASAASGYLREMRREDWLVLERWLGEFYAEALAADPLRPSAGISGEPPKHTGSQPQKAYTPIKPAGNVNSKPVSTAGGKLFIWQDGQPSAMGMICAGVNGAARLNLIYTPPELRRRGYGASVVSALSEAAQKSGYVPLLYTTADNTAANALYKSLGFIEAGRLRQVTFSNRCSSTCLS